jgi:aminopeptidase
MDHDELDHMLAKYADVTVRIGLNLRKGQCLMIGAILEDAPFIRKVAESAYKAGARYVDVWFSDEKINRLFYEYATVETAELVPEWILTRYEEYYRRGDAIIGVLSTDPNLLAGIEPEIIARVRKARAEKVNEPLRKYENMANWCVVATARPSWAKKVFPDLPVEEAQSKLWAAIFNACRIDTPDPVAAWETHKNKLLKYRDYLIARSYSGLHYRGPGTDLTIGLPKNQMWLAAQESFKNGITATVNIPTEEVFTAPHKDRAEGVVSASMPLNLSGVLIEDFSLTFENGRVVNVVAKKGETDLRKLIETDENAGRLGEAALVPNSSPISQRGHLFYNSLFDENAASHIALGNAYRNTIRGGEDMTEEEFAANGGNKSLIHVDFMVGSGELDIDGICEDGSHEPVMRAGEWAFEL